MLFIHPYYFSVVQSYKPITLCDPKCFRLQLAGEGVQFRDVTIFDTHFAEVVSQVIHLISRVSLRKLITQLRTQQTIRSVLEVWGGDFPAWMDRWRPCCFWQFLWCTFPLVEVSYKTIYFAEYHQRGIERNRGRLIVLTLLFTPFLETITLLLYLRVTNPSGKYLMKAVGSFWNEKEV